MDYRLRRPRLHLRPHPAARVLAVQIKRLDDRGSNLLELSCSETTERPLELIGVHSGMKCGALARML